MNDPARHDLPRHFRHRAALCLAVALAAAGPAVAEAPQVPPPPMQPPQTALPPVPGPFPVMPAGGFGPPVPVPPVPQARETVPRFGHNGSGAALQLPYWMQPPAPPPGGEGAAGPATPPGGEATATAPAFAPGMPVRSRPGRSALKPMPYMPQGYRPGYGAGYGPGRAAPQASSAGGTQPAAGWQMQGWQPPNWQFRHAPDAAGQGYSPPQAPGFAPVQAPSQLRAPPRAPAPVAPVGGAQPGISVAPGQPAAFPGQPTWGYSSSPTTGAVAPYPMRPDR